MNSERCRTTTKKGAPCTRKARYDGYCRLHAKLPWYRKYKIELIGVVTALVIGLLFFVWGKIRSTKQAEKLTQEPIQLRREMGGFQDYLDGLPTTSDMRKKKLLEHGLAAQDSFHHEAARDLFRGILSLQLSPSERIAVLILMGNTFAAES